MEEPPGIDRKVAFRWERRNEVDLCSVGRQARDTNIVGGQNFRLILILSKDDGAPVTERSYPIRAFT
jgi:hypothetical protein